MASSKYTRNPHDFKQEFLTCSLCTDLYNGEDRLPKCLPCLHCFCKSCLNRHIAGKPKVSCPDCRKEYVVPNGGADGFVTNFNVENLREYQNLHPQHQLLPENDGDISCTSCNRGNPATGHCDECDDFVCQNCTEMHSTMRLFQSHEIASLDDLRKPETQLKRRRTFETCRDHNKAYSMFCNTCKKPICDTCGQIVAHSNHEKVDLNKAIDEAVQVLRDLSNDVRKKKEPLEGLSATIDTKINDINAVFTRQEEDVNELFKNLESRLRDRCTQSKEELRDRCQVLNKLLQEQKDDVEALVAQYDSACDFADQMCEIASPKQLFKHKEMVTDQLNALSSESLSQTEPLANSFLDFNSDHYQAMKWGEEMFLSRIGGTRTSDSLASLCYTEVDIKSPVLSGMPQIVLIRAIKFDGKPQQTGGDPFTAELQIPDGTSIPCEVHDNDDGTYRIDYTATQQGTNRLDVRLFGKPIQGSPFAIRVQREEETEEEAKVVIKSPYENIPPHSPKASIALGRPLSNQPRGQIEVETEEEAKVVIKSPYENIPPYSPKASIALGRPVSNQLWSIKVSADEHDEYPKDLISVEDAVQLKVTNLTDNTNLELSCQKDKDGAVVFTCIPTAGSYSVKASMYSGHVIERVVHIQQFMAIDLCKTPRSFPTGITSSMGDVLFVSDTVDRVIYCYGGDGTLMSNISVNLSKSSQITIDEQGRLLLLFPQTRMVHTIDQQGNELSRWPCQKKNTRPVTIISSKEGRVIIADSKTPSMFIYKSDGEPINMQVLPTNSIKDGVNNICVDKRHTIILAHHSQAKIFTHNSNGQPRDQFTSGATSNQLAVASTHDDILLIAQVGTIRMIRFSGNKANFVGEISLGTGHILTGLISTNDGCVIGLDFGSKRIVKYGYQILKK